MLCQKNNRTAHLTAHSVKSVAYVTNNKRLANHWQTRSIAQPLCDSRATCVITSCEFCCIISSSRDIKLQQSNRFTTIFWGQPSWVGTRKRLASYGFCRAMLCIAWLLPTCGVRLSVCPFVTFVSCAKTNKDILEIFSPCGSQAILLFPYCGAIPTGTPLTGASNERGGTKTLTIFDQYLAVSQKRL